MTGPAAKVDFAIIGAGPAGEAATYKARELGASVAVIDREWFGGSCPHIGCVPSKALLNSAARHAANPATYDWPRASARRDYMVNRAADAPEPDDTGHVRGLETAGATVYRGQARIVGLGLVEVTHDDAIHLVRATNVVVAVGSVSKVPPLDGLAEIPYLDQPRCHPGAGAATQPARPGRRPDRLRTRPGVCPLRRPDDHRPVRPAPRPDGPPAQLGGDRHGPGGIRCDHPARRARRPGRSRRRRRTAPIGSTSAMARSRKGTRSSSPSGVASRSMTWDSSTTASTHPDEHRSRAMGAFASRMDCGSIGDPAGPELHTHQAHYQGELAIRMALGEAIVPDYRALPRATYTEPEAAFVGVTVEAAREAGLDAIELVADFARSARGYGVEADIRPRDDRRRPRDAPACRGGHVLPGRLGGHPRVRARHPGPGHRGRPRRDDPRVPVDLADPQRPLRGRPSGAGPGLALEDDAPVHHDEARDAPWRARRPLRRVR